MSGGERREAGEWKRIELQLDTAQIVIVLAMLVGLCATSFYLGRWIERDRWSEANGGGKEPSRSSKVTDAGPGDLTFFDTLGDKASEPGRQARTRPQAPSTPAPAASGDAAEGSDLATDGPAKSAPTAHAATGASTAPAPSAPGAPAPAVPGPAVSSGAYSVQVFAGDKSQAEKIAASLSRKGYPARVVGGTGSSGARVRVVGYKSKSDATRAAERLKREGNLNPWVLKAD